MAENGYRLQEFVAHSANVNCVKIGKKTCRLFVTGGDDEAVNVWSIDEPASITSLSGHTSPIESVAFDPPEVRVAAGASSGAVKLWDLEETKVIRTLTGHRSYCTTVEFHPFGEFFASGSMDTNLKIWDIRKKGCIHTYKSHTRAISTIRFTPDGRWVMSGGHDNVVKVWDLTAGKLLHEFKSHKGHIRSMDFHPLEFLLATGSSDKTIKFWDLETFELIGSTTEDTVVRSVTFHSDGRTLFSGLDNSLNVYSWEPVICHDTVNLGWSTLGDLCINDGKLYGCSYHQNSVGVWAADVSQIEPYTVQPKSDDDTKDIKNIYVDSMTSVRKDSSFSVSGDVSIDSNKELKSVKHVNEAVDGRTHSLVEKFEKRDKFDANDSHKPNLPSEILPNTNNVPTTTIQQPVNTVSCTIIPQPTTSSIPVTVPDDVPCVQSKTKTKASRMMINSEEANYSTDLVVQTHKISANTVREKAKAPLVRRPVASRRVVPEKARSSMLVDSPQTARDLTYKDDDVDIAAVLMQDHDVSLSTLRSRLTKLQVVQKFWERNDNQRAIDTLQKLSDHSVQADVISAMLDNMESLTLDLFSCLLPLLSGLLDSQTERHINVALNMLLKLASVFGPVIESTISAPTPVGVDLHAEKRLETCNQCYIHLQKIHKTLPDVIRRGGLTAKSAQELNRTLQQSCSF